MRQFVKENLAVLERILGRICWLSACGNCRAQDGDVVDYGTQQHRADNVKMCASCRAGSHGTLKNAGAGCHSPVRHRWKPKTVAAATPGREAEAAGLRAFRDRRDPENHPAKRLAGEVVGSFVHGASH